MTTDTDPVAGNWYRLLDRGEDVRVNAVDDDEGMVHIQDEDGMLDEIDLSLWFEMDIEPIATPDEWLEEDDSEDLLEEDESIEDSDEDEWSDEEDEDEDEDKEKDFNDDEDGPGERWDDWGGGDRGSRWSDD